MTAQNILQKMVDAMEVLNYQGTVVFLKNDKLETMKYFHTMVNNKQEERLISLNSPMREIVRSSDEVKCFFKATQQVVIDHRPYEHSFIVDVPKNLTELESSYQFDVVGEEEVAMMPAYVIAIEPKDEFRYVRKIWVDKKRYLPLKAAVYDVSGTLLEQVVFTELEVDEAPHQNSDQPLREAIKEQVANNLDLDIQKNWSFVVNALPKGFKRIFFTRKPLNKSEQPVDHALFSDGFASVSIYFERKKQDISLEAITKDVVHSVGAVNSISRQIDDSQLTVLGEVPVSTIKFIAAGVQVRPEQP
jgi:sigma-E factor negative regulatory protein RseB